MKRLVTLKGARVRDVDLVRERPDDATLLSLVLGPSGNLRAPTLKIGSLLLVGFSPEAYAAALP